MNKHNIIKIFFLTLIIGSMIFSKNGLTIINENHDTTITSIDIKKITNQVDSRSIYTVLENNIHRKNIIETETLFEDDMELNENNWNHFDLTKVKDGHWKTSNSGYNSYFWCGINETITKYDNNWNDIAMINNSINLLFFSNIYLKFDTYCRISENDYGFVELSRDGGRHWDKLAEFTGNLNWTTYLYNISSLNNIYNFLIRVRFLSNESLTDIGWLLDDITIIADNTTLFYDDFESNTNKWIIEQLRPGDWWQRIKKPKVNDNHNTAWWCGDELTINYESNMNNTLSLKNEIDLSKVFEVDILFLTWYNLSKFDIGYFEISNNEGVSWNIIDTFMGDSKVDNNIVWINKSYELNQLMGEKIIIRFRFVSDSYVEYEGWYIDDLKVIGKIDLQPPITSCELSGVIGQNDWYISKINLSLIPTDENGSGVKKTFYILNDEGKKTYATPIKINENGWHTIEYWSTDKLENIENHNYNTFKIDLDNPDVQIIQPEFGIYWLGRKIYPIFRSTLIMISKPIIIGDIKIRVDSSDLTSGVNRIEFYINEELKSIDYDYPYSWIWSEKNLHINYILKLVSYDDAGNIAKNETTIMRFF